MKSKSKDHKPTKSELHSSGVYKDQLFKTSLTIYKTCEKWIKNIGKSTLKLRVEKHNLTLIEYWANLQKIIFDFSFPGWNFVSLWRKGILSGFILHDNKRRLRTNDCRTWMTDTKDTDCVHLNSKSSIIELLDPVKTPGQLSCRHVSQVPLSG